MTQRIVPVAFALLLGSTVLSGADHAAVAQTAPAASAPVVPRPAPDSFANLADRLLPAVVNVSISATLKPGQDDDDGGPDDGPDDGPQVPDFPPGSPMEKFFHDFMNRKPSPDAPPRKMQALGSGFIISPDGYIVTNNHVVKDADQVSVTLQDDTVLKAHIVGRDSRTDLAVIKVDAPHPLPTVPFGNSDTARVGDWVLAIGNPFGLSGTVTSGIVSSRGRSIDRGVYDDFIQTDAPINRGNSGGPLFNLKGEVVGINTAIYSPSGGSIGIGFAIPSNDARGVIDQLRRLGHVQRGWIGIRVQDVSHDIADSLGLKVAKGALVAGVEPKGPAAVSGMKTGDVITKLNGEVIDGRSLPRLVAAIAPGTKTAFGVWRKGQDLTMDVVIKPSPEAPDMPPTAPRATGHATLSLADLGLTLGAIDDDARQKFKLSDSQRGVVVTAVTADGPAATRGLQAGDVVTELQQVEVDSPDALSHELARARAQKKHSILLLVQNSDGMRWVPLPLNGD
ncbi:endopeptidase DegP/Do [Neoasaia chiangmaiensis NBRC 101099]|uniref:Probable periplasmic serine endoprotease DegP-like n=1 Tax=Neoasaia chiangmaiensis TaxID=320497 RepID=A0A1U9KSY3_9PROT|nr:DegQ family serine endoprotease [Neoasaia chiangmaiensis]AQS88780.1 serine protease [Neoasaia chiangmaiensis]GBR40783.1 endopeptidase DegP/Do [Neoasaia chiangmaiensis NBRC 101099]GEN13740.1 serine protease [Neoasaia chiangmaiensis]